jgi:hypothetical protein
MFLQLAESPRRKRGGKEQVLITKYKRESNRVPEHWRTLNEDMFLAKRTKEQRKADRKERKEDRKERKEDRKANKGKRNPLKKVLLAPGRAAFIALLDLNIDGIATRLAKGDISKLGEQWIKLGGDRNKLIKNINKGAKKKPKKLGFLSKLVGKEGMGEDEFMLAQRYYPILNEDNDTEENPAGVSKDVKAKILAISTGVATTIGGLVGGPAGVTLGAAGPALGIVIIGILPLLKKGADLPQAEAETPPTSEIVEPPVDVDDDKDDDKDDDVSDNKTKIKKYLPYVAVGLVAVVGGYFLLKRKK